MGERDVIRPASEGAPWDLVFLDRDGTVNARVDGGYVTSPDRLTMLPGASAAVRRLNDAGCRVVLVTNQRGLATGALTPTAWGLVTEQLRAELARAGAVLDHLEVCPHEEGTCDCRKPLDGMFRRALAEAPWADPRRCAMVGDMPSDIIPARGLGMRTVLLGSDVDDLAAAVDVLLTG